LNLKRNKKSLAKISILIAIVLISIFLLTGCVNGMTPVGWSGVAVSNGTVYMGSKEGRLVSFKPADGTRMWAEAIKDASAGSGSCALFGGGSSGGAGGCSGSVPAVAIYGTPALSGDLVYIAGYNGKIYAYNTSSLQPRWVYPREGNLKPIVSTITISGNLLYFGCTDNKLYALDVVTGDFKWDFSTDGEIWSSPVVDNGMVFITSFDKKVYALDALTGAKKWEFATSATNVAAPVTSDGVIYVGSLDRNFYAINENDGKLSWKYTADNWFWAKPVVHNGIVYAPCMDNKVYGFNAKTGEKVFDYNVEGQVSSWPIVVDSKLIVATQNGKLWSLSTDPLKKDQKIIFTIPEQVTSPLAVMDTTVYINGPDNNIRPFNLTTEVALSPISIKSNN
jgi:outer membrane protein assembly factor BamB